MCVVDGGCPWYVEEKKQWEGGKALYSHGREVSLPAGSEEYAGSHHNGLLAEVNAAVRHTDVILMKQGLKSLVTCDRGS